MSLDSRYYAMELEIISPESLGKPICKYDGLSKLRVEYPKHSSNWESGEDIMKSEIVTDKHKITTTCKQDGNTDLVARRYVPIDQKGKEPAISEFAAYKPRRIIDLFCAIQSEPNHVTIHYYRPHSLPLQTYEGCLRRFMMLI